MIPSAELRWFYRGAIPSEIWTWFHTSDRTPATPPVRVDSYLRVEEGNSLGIKLREGRIEVKQRYGQGEPHHVNQQITGHAERWRKWSFELAEFGDLGSTDLSSWIEVEKERNLRTYQVRDSGGVTEVPTDTVLEKGCAWELTTVHCDRSTAAWWTLGFEAFGQEPQLQEILMTVVESICSWPDTPALLQDDSYGYPMWLQIIDEP